ncbi:MAG: hypothetical protein HC774_02100, partial [Sphingomonadales bacterium]|nr:hypothetical protein [Sphingomonadales bacterium]
MAFGIYSAEHPYSGVAALNVVLSHFDEAPKNGKDRSDETDIDVSAFDYPAGQRFKAEMFIPAHDDLKDFSPDIALVGPGLPLPKEPLPFEIPQGMGAVIARSDSTYAYFDIFTQMTYYPRAKIEIEKMPQSARYYMVVFGKPVGRSLYALDIGIMETFAPQVL